MLKMLKRFLAVILALILCVACCNVMLVYADEEAEPSTEIYNNETENIVANEETEKSAVYESLLYKR